MVKYMSKEELSSTEVIAWKLQFYNLFSMGQDMVVKCLQARFNNTNPSENYTPILKEIFWKTLDEYIKNHPDCKLDNIQDDHANIIGDGMCADSHYS